MRRERICAARASRNRWTRRRNSTQTVALSRIPGSYQRVETLGEKPTTYLAFVDRWFVSTTRGPAKNGRQCARRARVFIRIRYKIGH